MHEEVRVVAAVVERRGRWLLGLRPTGKRHGGLWEFPGGKLGEGESVLDATRRELSEELSLRVTSLGRTLFTARDGETPFVIDFVEATVEGEAEAREHAAIGWFDLVELEELPLAPADRAFATWLGDHED
jgi:8-oxo-dGTP diphosphatase